jgi:hypothetical protein
LPFRVNQSLAKASASGNYPSAPPPRLTQIDAPFSPRLSRDKPTTSVSSCELMIFESKTGYASGQSLTLGTPVAAEVDPTATFAMSGFRCFGALASSSLF